MKTLQDNIIITGLIPKPVGKMDEQLKQLYADISWRCAEFQPPLHSPRPQAPLVASSAPLLSGDFLEQSNMSC